jgi:hypothetical protein
MLVFLPIMMVYATSVDSQGTVLSTAVRVSLNTHHVLLLVAGRAVENILLGTLKPGRLLISVFMSTKSTLKKFDRTPKL